MTHWIYTTMALVLVVIGISVVLDRGGDVFDPEMPWYARALAPTAFVLLAIGLTALAWGCPK